MVQWTPRLAYPIVFGAGFCMLLIEVTAGRLLAPSIGMSVPPVDSAWRQSAQTTFVVLASQVPLDLDRLTARRPPGVTKERSLVPLSGVDLRRYLDSGASMVLTDDRAPVENFLARVYAEVLRGRRR